MNKENKDYLGREDFIEMLAKKTKMTKGETRKILDAIADIFAESVVKKQVLKIKYFGKLYYSIVPERKIKEHKDRSGKVVSEMTLPETVKVIFKLSDNIRYPDLTNYPE